MMVMSVSPVTGTAAGTPVGVGAEATPVGAGVAVELVPLGLTVKEILLDWVAPVKGSLAWTVKV